MRISRIVLIALLPISALGAPAPKGAATQAAEIPVTLFQHPCTLSGPFNEKTLLQIHSISPEKMPPGLPSGQLKPSLEKLRSAEGLPSALENYRARLTERLETKVVFEEALAAAKKSGSLEPLLASIPPKLKERQRNEFTAAMKRLDSPAKDAPPKWGTAYLDQLSTAFEEALGPHPEEEFHRAIDRLQVRYACNYDESGPAGD